MIYTELTAKAMKIAYQAHHGQVDKCGIPYIFHPIHLAERMFDEETTCVALLHDVIEDTDITLEQLSADFPEPIVSAVEVLTHRKGQDYYEYIRKVRENRIAKKVKIADIEHNFSASRADLIQEDDETRKRRLCKYQEAYRILTSEK